VREKGQVPELGHEVVVGRSVCQRWTEDAVSLSDFFLPRRRDATEGGSSRLTRLCFVSLTPCSLSNTLKRALQFLDPHNAMPSRSKQLRQASSKVWIAPKRLLKEDVRPNSTLVVCWFVGAELTSISFPSSPFYPKGALYFPNLAGHSLRADLSEPIIHTTDVLKGRISLVSCAGSILSTVSL